MNTKEIKNGIEIKKAAMCAHACSPKRCIVIHIQKQCPMVIVYKLPCLRPIVKWEAIQNVIAKKCSNAKKIIYPRMFSIN